MSKIAPFELYYMFIGITCTYTKPQTTVLDCSAGFHVQIHIVVAKTSTIDVNCEYDSELGKQDSESLRYSRICASFRNFNKNFSLSNGKLICLILQRVNFVFW